MQLRIVVEPTGKISFFSDDGTFAEGAEKIEELIKVLRAQGINLADVSQVEQHRHDGEGLHSHSTNHSH